MSDSISPQIKALLECYFPEVRYLQSFAMSHDVGIGNFLVARAHYCEIESLEYLTATQLQLCLNQMLYCYFAANGALSTFEDYRDYSNNQLSTWQATKTYIIEQEFRFHRKILVADEFSGTMHLLRFRQTKGTCLAVVEFDFGDGACIGVLKAVLVR